MTEYVLWSALLLAYFLGILTAYYVPLIYTDIRKRRVAKKLRQKRELATQVKGYLSYLDTPQCLDKFISGGRNAPGWTDPEQWLLLERAKDIVKGQWSEEQELETIRDSTLLWHQSVLTLKDDAIRLQAEAAWRMQRFLDLLNKSEGGVP